MIIALGGIDKESFGEFYEDQPDIFYETTTITIDTHAEHEQFGQLNIINVRASSVSEIVAELFEAHKEHTLSQEQSQALLTGIIHQTDCFKKKNTTPRSLRWASTLMDSGADQQAIIKHLYKTQPFSILKLWGRAMARLRWESVHKMAWTTLTKDDFSSSKTSLSNIPTILEKIKSNYAAGEIFTILYEHTDGTIRAIVDQTRTSDDSLFRQRWTGEQDSKYYSFILESSTLPEAAKELLEKISAPAQ